MNEARFGRRGWTVVAIVVVAILAPTLALPLGPDSSMFFVSAQKIIHQGAVHYRDIVDVKPPLIYYLYALAMATLGESALALRVFDLLLQLATTLLLVQLVRRSGGTDAWAALTAILYALLYGGLGYAYTMQAESYVAGLAAAMAWLLLGRRTRGAIVAAGALAGVGVLLKFPLGVLFVALLVAEALVIRSRPREWLGNALLIGAGFVGVLATLALYLWLGRATPGFAAMNAFIAGYAQTKESGLAGRLAEIATQLPNHFVTELSLLVVVAVPATLLLLLRSRRDASDRNEPHGLARGDVQGRAQGDGRGEAQGASDERPRALLRFMLIALLLLVLSLVVEGKYYRYQMSRLNGPAAVVAAYGLALAGRYLWSRRRERFVGILAVGLAVAAVAFSPVATWTWFTATPAMLGAVRGEPAFDAYFDRMAVQYPRSELKRVGEYIRARKQKGDEVLALSSIAALVHLHAGSVPTNRIYHSAFLIARFSPPTWLDETRRYAYERRPRFIVVQRGDDLFELTGSRASSDTLVTTLGLKELLGGYRMALRTERLEVWERR